MKSSPGRSKPGSRGPRGSAETGGPPAEAPAGARRAPPGGRRAGNAAGARPAAGRTLRPLTTAGFFERLDRGAFPTSLYLDGPSEPLKAALLAELRHAWAGSTGGQPARVFRAAETSVEEILGAYQGISLFSPRDLLIVLEVEDLGRSDKRVAALADGIARAEGESCLTLVESEAEKERKSLDPLRATCAARWSAFPPRRGELSTWCTRRLARARVDAEDGVVDSVIEACEDDPLACFNEIDRLVAYGATSGRLTAAEVATLLRPVAGADLADYLGAVAHGQGGLAARRLGRVLAAGAGEGAVLWALSNLVGGALGGWARERELSMTLGRRLGPPALARAMDAVYRAEAAWKSGRADPVAVLEQATRMVCSGAGGRRA